MYQCVNGAIFPFFMDFFKVFLQNNMRFGLIPHIKIYLDICDSCVHRRIYVLSRGIPKPSTTDNINNTCKLELDVYPVVPTISGQTQFNPMGTYGHNGCAQISPISAPTYGLGGGYLNQSFTDSEQSSSTCVLENPDNIDLPLHQPPYLLSTYV